MADVGVVHLVRKANGIEALRRFVVSYRQYPAGMAHDLIIVFKGFESSGGTADCDRTLDGVTHQRLFLPDRGLDIGPYFKTVRRYEHRYFCFLNSFSRLMAAGWLGKLHRRAVQPGVGLVGATGSYQSFARLNEQGRSLGLRARLRHVAGGNTPVIKAQRAGAWVLGGLGLWKPARHFPAFPNYHLRTNGFMAARDTLLHLRVPPMLFKLSAFLFESGRESLTRQVLRLGLRALVIDSRGDAFEKEQWHLSDTYRQARQERLLIADNQTDAYERSDREERANLSRIAWGEQARPA